MPLDVVRRSTSRRMRIGIPAELAASPKATGYGNMWHHVLGHLRGRVEVVAGPSRRFGRRPDVWLADGHQPVSELPDPLVVHLHEAGWATEELQDTLDPLFLEAIERNTSAACRRAAAVITPSRSSRDQVVNRYGVDPTRVFAVHHGVDTSVFTPAARAGVDQVLARIDTTRDPFVLFVSSLHPRKNLPVLREAIDRLIGDGTRVQLVVVGADAPDRADSSALRAEALAPLPSSGARVVDAGRPSDAELASLMAGAAAFCLPSLMEGFGLTVLEAMACGAPVVVADRGSLPEVVAGCGIVVEPTPHAIAEALRQVLADQVLAARLGTSALERARGMTWDVAADGWHDVLAGAAGRAPFPPAERLVRPLETS